MKKIGFTLSELIVALGVVGVVSAMIVPLLGGLLPDKNKMNVVKTYGILSSVNAELLSDLSLNWSYDSKGNECSSGLTCDGTPYNSSYTDTNKYNSQYKYCYLFTDRLKLKETPVLASSYTFTTADGTQWEMQLANSSASGFITTVKYDTDSKLNCTYSSKCKKPDKFQFYVKPNGKVYANDPLTNSYLNNRYKHNDRKNDLANAAADKTQYVQPLTIQED